MYILQAFCNVFSYNYRRIFLFASLLYVFATYAESNYEHVSFSADAVFLQRSKVNDRVLIKGNTNDNKIMTTQTLLHNFHPNWGFRAALNYVPDLKNSLEFSYMGIFNWKGIAHRSDTGELDFDFKPNTFNDWQQADSAKGVYRSKFYTFEGNYWCHLSPRRMDYFSVAATIGIRYIDLDEKFRMEFVKGTNQSDYKITTKNRATGVQAGGDFRFHPMKWFAWGLLGRLGGLWNFAKQKTVLKDDDNLTILRDFSPKRQNFVFLAEARAFMEFYLGQYVTMQFAYELLFLHNMALAPQQIGFSSPGNRVNTHGRPLYHGALGGLSWHF